MKLDQRNFEIYCLSSITKSVKCMENLTSKNITDNHFEFQSESDLVSYSKAIFSFAMEYWNVSKSLLTDLVLESMMNSKKVPSTHRIKIISLWSEIEDCDFDENNFHEIATQLKQKQALKILSKTIEESANKLKSDGLKDAISFIENNLVFSS